MEEAVMSMENTADQSEQSHCAHHKPPCRGADQNVHKCW